MAGPAAESFTFDAGSNIASRTGPNASNSYDGANRLTSDGVRSFTWDGADRLVQRGADTFSYDPLARITSATVAAVTRTYAYDGDGLLRSRTEVGATTSLLWDSSVAPARLLQSGGDRVVHGVGPLYLVRADGSTLTLARDGLGSVRAELDDAGILRRSFRYAAYGTLAASHNGPPTILGYAGELADPSGLVYLRARWYDPAIGRFMSRDPFPGVMGRPTSLNAFQYSHGRPILWSDPLGLDPNPLSGVGRDVLGAVNFLLLGGGTSSYRPDGVEVVTNAGGILGSFARLTNAAALTASATLIVTANPDVDEATLAHEYGHIEHARALGPLHIPSYFAQFMLVPFTMLASQTVGRITGGRQLNPFDWRDWHDANLAEWSADMRRGINTWARNP